MINKLYNFFLNIFSSKIGWFELRKNFSYELFMAFLFRLCLKRIEFNMKNIKNKDDCFKLKKEVQRVCFRFGYLPMKEYLFSEKIRAEIVKSIYIPIIISCFTNMVLLISDFFCGDNIPLTNFFISLLLIVEALFAIHVDSKTSIITYRDTNLFNIDVCVSDIYDKMDFDTERCNFDISFVSDLDVKIIKKHLDNYKIALDKIQKVDEKHIVYSNLIPIDFYNLNSRQLKIKYKLDDDVINSYEIIKGYLNKYFKLNSIN